MRIPQAITRTVAAAALTIGRISVAAPSTVKAGDDLTIAAKLTRKSGKKDKAYAKKKLLLVLLPAPGAQSGGVIVTKKTSRTGKATFVLDTSEPELVGQKVDFLVAFQGGSRAKRAESTVFSVTFTG